MRAMILAAGYGTRLWPLTIDRTKPAIPFLGRPLVGYVAEYLAGYGYDEVVVNLHHRPESVRAALGDGSRYGVRIHYVEEPVILGPSGAIDNARPLLENETFVVANGKIITDIDLGGALQLHRRTNSLATLILRRNVRREPFSTVTTLDGRVTGFGPPPKASDNARELVNSQAGQDVRRAAKNESGAAKNESGAAKNESETGGRGIGTSEAGASEISASEISASEMSVSEMGMSEAEAPLMFTGIQILEPAIFSYIPRGVFSHTVTDVYPQAIANGERIAAYVADGMWYELSTIQRYLDISLALLAQQQRRDTVAGTGCFIDAGADVREAVLWENVRVERGAQVRRAVLGAGVVVPAGARIENAAVVRAELVQAGSGIDGEPPPKALPGEVDGGNFVVKLAE